MSDNAENDLYRVDIESGSVAQIGAAPPTTGEAQGIDVAELSSGDLHATVVVADRASVTLDHLRTSGTPSTDGSSRDAASQSDTSWPPALVYFAIFLAIVALGAVGTMFWRARSTIRPR